MEIQITCVFIISIVFCVTYETDGATGAISIYMGCYKDGGSSNRLMKDHHEDFQGTLTPDKCNEYCRGKQFAFAGTENSFQCFCSEAKPPEVNKTLASECNSNCAGDPTKTCGGNNRLAVFATGLIDPTANDEALRPMGCFKDTSKNRFLSGFRLDFPGSLTSHKCVRLCARKGFQYAGVEYGKECYCGNRKLSFKEYAGEEECSKECEGDSNQFCGGFWRIHVFKTSKADPNDVPDDGQYIGCYEDLVDSPILDGHKEDCGSFLTPFKCTGLCHSKGFLYSGTQYSYLCFCGDKPPSPNSKVGDAECDKPCSGNRKQMCGGDSKISIRETGIPDVPAEDRYVGCFNDINYQIFGDVKLIFDKTNSPRRCMNYCFQLGYRYSGVEYGKECFCGNEEPNKMFMVSDGECNMACSGDSEMSCGSGWKIAVYETGDHIKTPVQEPTPKPCVPSETVVSGRTSVCVGEVIFEDKFNTALSSDWGHVVMIADDPSVLYCDEKSGEPQTNDEIKQSTDSFNKFSSSATGESVEFLGHFVDNVNKTDENSIFGEMVASRIQKLNSSNQAVARNLIENLFSELEKEELGSAFKGNTSLAKPDENSPPCPASDNSVSTTSSMPQDTNVAEDFEFAVITADPENSFTRNNKLIIKPTFLNESFVRDGFLNLSGCTGRLGTRQCELQAVYYNILPPVARARIHTRNSFSFRYGTVEIRAKLPLGDWLVPELWLEPKQHYYGPGYRSGRISIAMARGNSDFECNGEDYGNLHLESGVVMGPENNVQKRTLMTKLSDNWHDQFHNYTLTWTPDSITFKIDNRKTQELVPSQGKLCEVIGFQDEECLIWSSGLRTAPFDQDFYISLGLSVGNFRDFPDECKNRGKAKPWKNSDPKAMLKFFLDSENWKPTWTEENSSLQVEHIRVTAL